MCRNKDILVVRSVRLDLEARWLWRMSVYQYLWVSVSPWNALTILPSKCLWCLWFVLFITYCLYQITYQHNLYQCLNLRMKSEAKNQSFRGSKNSDAAEENLVENLRMSKFMSLTPQGVDPYSQMLMINKKIICYQKYQLCFPVFTIVISWSFLFNLWFCLEELDVHLFDLWFV